MVAARSHFPKENPKSSLGNDRKIGVPLPKVPEPPPDETATEYRFRLLKWARSCYGNHDKRLDACQRVPLPNGWGVDVVRNPNSQTAHFVGLEQCSRVWTCPVCSQRITNERRKELSFALAAAQRKGWTAILVTYTLRHKYNDLLESTVAALQGSLRDFKSGRAWQDIKREYGVQGGVKSLEITFNENGWHPHAHELMFLDVPADRVNIPGFKNWLADRWLAMLEKHGFDASYTHGIDVKTADSEIASYIAKWGHEPRELSGGVEYEIAKAPNKKAHRDGLTPFQLLEAVSGGDARARVLFQEYARCMEGKRQLVWSPGLRAALEMDAELPDEQIPLFETEQESYVVAEFSKQEWRRCAVYELQPIILQLCAAGATEALRAVLRQRDIYADIFDPPDVTSSASHIEKQQIEQPAASSEIYVQTTLPGVAERVNYA